MGGQIHNTFKFVFPSSMVANLVTRPGADEHQLVPNEEYRTSMAFLLTFNPNGHEIQVMDSWFGEVEPEPEDPSNPGFYDFIFVPRFPPSGIDDSAPRVITIKDLSDSGSGINFTYDKTPKFREQETPHVYFDTVKGSRAEMRTYTYEDGTVDAENRGRSMKKVLDFTSPDQLYGWTLTDGIGKWDLHAGAFELVHDDFYRFYDEIDGVFVITDKPINISDGPLPVAIIPEPGVYISDRLTLVGGVTVASDEGLFSKNVTVKAHTEYTAHVNGRIGESSGGLNTLVLNYEPSVDGDTITGATWKEAKNVFLSGKKVIALVYNKTCVECTELGNDSHGEYLSFDATNMKWYSDGSVFGR